MKVTREQAAENRERVLRTASTLFRERGFGGIGVADLMKNAGMTHGAFYGQFTSKEDLIAQALAFALESTVERWSRLADDGTHAGDGLSKVVDAYLSTTHRDAPGKGCVLASLGPDVAREGPAVRAVVTDGTVAMIDMLAGLQPDADPAARRRHAIAAYASLIGAMVLARVVDDDALSQEVLSAVSASLKTPTGTST